MEEQTEKNNKEEMEEIELWEFSLDEEEIDELIGELQKLKQTKTKVSFDIDEDNELLIHYEEEEDEKETEESKDENSSN
ncbi:hypothetical protein ACFLZJ_01760 [Nanoarchaeota archaeon]